MNVNIANYGQKRDVDATPEEIRIYELINDSVDTDIELVRRSDSYVTAAVGDWDLARIKFTDRAKWIRLAPDFDKVAISDPEDVAKMDEDVRAAYRFNEPYL